MADVTPAAALERRHRGPPSQSRFSSLKTSFTLCRRDDEAVEGARPAHFRRLPFARGCYSKHSMMQMRDGPFTNVPSFFKLQIFFPTVSSTLPPSFGSFFLLVFTSITMSVWDGRKLPGSTFFGPYLARTLANVTDFAAPRPALIRSPTLGAYVFGSRPRNFAVVPVILASRIALTT